MAEKEYIERGALLKTMCGECFACEDGKCTVNGRCDEYRMILNAPAADVAPVVRGRWLGWGKGGTPTYENYGTCSVCCEDAEIYTEHRNYCPNCGADMGGKA